MEHLKNKLADSSGRLAKRKLLGAPVPEAKKIEPAVVGRSPLDAHPRREIPCSRLSIKFCTTGR
jgi:hypothetical protein